MNTKQIIYLLLISLNLFFFSCDEDPLKYKRDIAEIVDEVCKIEQTYYDKITVQNQESYKLSEKYITKIVFYEIINYEYFIKNTTYPTYTPTGDCYFIDFKIEETVSLKELYYNFAVRFYLSDSSFKEITRKHYMLSFPYDSVKILFDVNTICYNQDYFDIQDFDFIDDILYFHPYGASGLYEFNKYGENKELVNYDGGDYIACDSNFIFIDWRHGLIKRYNIKLSNIDLSFDLSNLEYSRIWGLECWNKQVYVMFENQPNPYIAVFDYDGNYIKSIPYLKSNYHLTIDSDIAYSRNLEDGLIRFDLNTETFLEDKFLPTEECEAIHIEGNYLFYVDYNRQLICYLPVSQLK